jgi:hypothetical protein
MNSEPDQIDMMDADELRVELRKLVQQITPPPERGSQPHSVGWSKWVDAGDALSLALTALQHGIGCGCGGDYGACNYCREASDEADKAAEKWSELKRASTVAVSDKAAPGGTP